MNRALQTYTPRAHPLNYDSLQIDIGCQTITGTQTFSLLPFEQICVAYHDPNSGIFNQDDRVSYCNGPNNTGEPPPWPIRWAGWIASSSIRIAKAALITLPNETGGSPSGLWPTYPTGASKIAIGFNPEGLLGIALQIGSDIRVKWFKDADGIFGDLTFLGASPVMIGDAPVAISDTRGYADLALYYLNPATPNAIFARFEKEDFATEHLVNGNLPSLPAKLVDAEIAANRIYLYGRDGLGRDLTLRTPSYSVVQTLEVNHLSLFVSSGRYENSAVLGNIPIDKRNKSTLTLFIKSGVYQNPIVSPGSALSGDAGSLSIALTSGQYA